MSDLIKSIPAQAVSNSAVARSFTRIRGWHPGHQKAGRPRGERPIHDNLEGLRGHHRSPAGCQPAQAKGTRAASALPAGTIRSRSALVRLPQAKRAMRQHGTRVKGGTRVHQRILLRALKDPFRVFSPEETFEHNWA